MPYHRALIHNEPSKASALSSLTRSCHSISKSTFKCVCGYAPRGIERNKRQNLKRHQETCRVLSPSGHREKPYTCSFQNCGRAFTRPDNLLVHQRTQGHLGDVELGLDPEAMRDILNAPTLKRHRIGWGNNRQDVWRRVLNVSCITGLCWIKWLVSGIDLLLELSYHLWWST